MLTSREKPKEFISLEGEKLPIRSLQLTGLQRAAGGEVFSTKGSFYGSEQEWQIILEHYAGNPLALKMVAAGIQELFDSKFSPFLQLLNQGVFVFDDIRDLLERQFNRLCKLEKEVMYWLAIEREPLGLQELLENFLSPERRQKLPEALRSLGQRSLIEKRLNSFTQQPVVMEYITERLIEQVFQEITSGKIAILNSHALIKAGGKDYVREATCRFIVQPLIEKLHS